ncbi:MAG TPA: dihydrofolate reductase [Nocardioidaceae bacterium]|nr:dihydrofolate reductase [Nocardioidaceae bacterium]
MTGLASPDRRSTTVKLTVLVAAVADNGVIGLAGDIPWRIPADLKHFRTITTGNTVVMGRRTYESIGRPLPHRTNIVVTRQDDWSADGVLVAHSVEEAIERAQAFEGDIMVIGGAQVYAAAMDHADVQVLTEVHSSPAGDTYYPDFKRDEWVEKQREQHDGFDLVWLWRAGAASIADNR